MAKSLIGNKINAIKKSLRITDFYLFLDVSKAAYSNYLNGKTKPDIEFLMRLSNKVARSKGGQLVDMNWLIDDFDRRPGPVFVGEASLNQVEKQEERPADVTKEAAPQEKNAAVFQKSEGLLPEEWRVPVQLAAKGRNSTNNGFLPDPDSDFLESVLIPKEAMLARISGDSMSPVILSGQYAIIGPQFLDSALPVDRMIVVVEVFDNPDTTVTIDSDWVGFYCKRIQQRDNICYFTSINPDGDSFSVARENCRLWPVIGTLYAGHGVPPED